MKRALTAADILPLDAYERVRGEKRRAIVAMKNNRRLAVGPHATFYFENYDTMWLQVQEMLRIEKGGEEQLKEELQAYNPLIPNGRELVATLMFEIDDPVRRAAVLAQLGGVENHIELRIGGEAIKAPGRARPRLHFGGRQGIIGSVRAFPVYAAADYEVFRAPPPKYGRGHHASGLRPYGDNATGGQTSARRRF